MAAGAAVAHGGGWGDQRSLGGGGDAESSVRRGGSACEIPNRLELEQVDAPADAYRHVGSSPVAAVLRDRRARDSV